MSVRLLIASRRASTRERLRAALEAEGYGVRATCANAAETLIAARRRVDVCIVHLDLPGGGLAACRALAALKHPPRILVLASASREADVAAAVRAGADGFIVDDLDPRQIPAAVDEVAAGRPVLSAGSTAHLIAELRAPEPAARQTHHGVSPRMEE